MSKEIFVLNSSEKPKRHFERLSIKEMIDYKKIQETITPSFL